MAFTTSRKRNSFNANWTKINVSSRTEMKKANFRVGHKKECSLHICSVYFELFDCFITRLMISRKIDANSMENSLPRHFSSMHTTSMLINWWSYFVRNHNEKIISIEMGIFLTAVLKILNASFLTSLATRNHVKSTVKNESKNGAGETLSSIRWHFSTDCRWCFFLKFCKNSPQCKQK